MDMLKRHCIALLCLIWPMIGAADDVSSVRYYELSGDVEVSVTGAGTTPQTPFAIASLGKTMTSVAVLRLVDRGILSLDDRLDDLLARQILDGLDDTGRVTRNVTLRDLLAMTSGLPDYYTDDYLEDALDDPERVQTARMAISYAAGGALFPAGAGFDYSNTNYVLAGLILETVTGLSYAQVMKEEVFGPAQMQGAFVFGARGLPFDFPNGHEDGDHVRAYYQSEGFGDGGVIATAPDVAAFYRALFVDRRLLSDAALRTMLSDQIGEGYGLGIDISDGLYGHSGGDLGFSSDVRFDPNSGAVAVILIASDGGDTSWTYDRLLD